MDERQQQIKEGAGLEESRLNTEFIDFVQRWGGPFLILCAVVMAGWAGWNWWQKRQSQQVDDAFAQYEAQIAGGNPSPEALKAVAEEFEGVGSVSMLARLDAADVYTGSIRSGVKAGVTLNPDGTPASPDDVLSEEDRARLLEQATALYQRVFDSASAATGKGLLAIRAGFGLAAMAECRGDIAAARGFYERVVQIGEANAFANHVALAKARLGGLEAVATPVALLAQADLPVRPAPPAPELPGFGPDANPAGPLPTGLDQPTINPFNPEATPTTPSTEPAPAPAPVTPDPAGVTPASPPAQQPDPQTPPVANPGSQPTVPPTPPGH